MKKSKVSDGSALRHARQTRHGLRVVLVRPIEPGNVGAVARAMHNLAFEELRIVLAPGVTRENLLADDAWRFATHARRLLESCKFESDLPSAVSDCVGTFAFSARLGRSRSPRLALGDACSLVQERLEEGPVALLFGSEDHGLLRADLEHATHLVHIPAPGENPVFNLAQSVLLGLWEVVRAGRTVHVKPGATAEKVLLATAWERDRLRADWSDLLVTLGYSPTGRGTLHSRVLKRMVDLVERGGNERSDFSMLHGLAEFTRRALQRHS